MRIVMMGSGGVGGFFGGRLANAGEDVRFVARGAHLQAMRTNGLTIENEPQGDIQVVGVRASENPAELGPADLVIISVKLWDTQAAAKQIAPLVGAHTAVLSLQNGVIKDEILRGIFPEKNIMGGVAYVATHISRPGVIHQVGTMQRIVVGEYDGRVSDRAKALHEALSMPDAERLRRAALLAEAGAASPPREWFADQVSALDAATRRANAPAHLAGQRPRRARRRRGLLRRRAR